MARPRKPTKRKEIEGTARNDRLNPNEPVPTGQIGPPANGLTKYGKRRWTEVAAAAGGWLTDADRHTLELYCVAWEVLDRARRQLNAGGMIYKKGETGYTQESAYLRNFRSLLEDTHKLGAQLGLDPVSRSKIDAKVDTVDNRFAGLRAIG